jgi:hypothetical protein
VVGGDDLHARVRLADHASDVKPALEMREVVVGDRKALHAETGRPILQHAVEGRDPVRSDPAIRLVKGEEAPHIRLYDRDEAKSHADYVGQRAAVVLQHVLERAVGTRNADVEGRQAAVGREVELDGLLSRQNLLDEGRQQGLERPEIASARATMRGFDEPLHITPDGEPPLGELHILRQ